MRYDVKVAYNAQGDGVTNDTAAIQAAIDDANMAGGGVVYLPKGVYIVGCDRAENGCLTLKSGVVLQGDGIYVSVIKVRDNNRTGVCGVVRIDSDEAATDMGIEFLTIDGNRARNNNVTGIKWSYDGIMNVNTRKDLSIHRVEVKDCNDYGFDGYEPCKKVHYSDCICHGNGKMPEDAKYG